MRRILKHSSYRKNIKLSLRYGKKITSIILVVMGIRFILLLSFDEVCAACQKVIIEIMIGISSVFIPRTLLWITFPLVLGMFQQDTPWWRLRSYASGACWYACPDSASRRFHLRAGFAGKIPKIPWFHGFHESNPCNWRKQAHYGNTTHDPQKYHSLLQTPVSLST